MNDNKTYKSGAIVKLIIWSVVLLILVSLFATLMILNNGNAFGLKELPAIMTTYKYDFPEKYSAGDAVYTDEVKKLDIEWISGDVTVKVYDGDDDDDSKASRRGKKKNPILSAITGALWLLTVCAYLAVSFYSGAWHLTWLIFLITTAIDNIIEAIFEICGKRYI